MGADDDVVSGRPRRLSKEDRRVDSAANCVVSAGEYDNVYVF